MSLLKYESQIREPLVDGEKDYHQVTEDIIRPIEMKPTRLWYIGFYISVALLLFGVYKPSPSRYTESLNLTLSFNLFFLASSVVFCLRK